MPWASRGEAGRDGEQRHRGAESTHTTTTPRSVCAAGRAGPRRCASSRTKTGAHAKFASGTRQPARNAHSGRCSWRPTCLNADDRRAISQFVSRTKLANSRNSGRDADQRFRTTSPPTPPRDSAAPSRLMMQQRISHDVNERGQAERGDGRDQGGAQSGDRRSGARVDVLLGGGGIESLDQTPARYHPVSRGRAEIALAPTGRRRRTWTNRDPAVSRG